MSSNGEEEDPIDSLLNQATAYAEKNATCTDFNYNYPNDKLTSCNDVLNDKHNLIHVSSTGDDDSSDVQRGMFAKCDIKAGTMLVTSRPIVVHWDAEDQDDASDSEDDIDEVGEEEEPSDNESTDKKLKSDATVANWAKEKNKQKVQSSIEMAALLKRNKKDYEDLPEGFNLYNDANSDDDQSTDGKLKSDDSADDDDDSGSNSIQGATGSTRNGVLVLQAIEKIKQDKSLWTDTLSKLYPRSIDSALNLPPWFCSDVTIGMDIEQQFKSLSEVFKDEEVCNEISTRLPLIIRYNVLSIETCSELFVYPDVQNGGMVNLAGTGLYGPEISYFNHSCTPNVSRYCIGDVMFFVTNRDVKEGDELCFSYIEHEFLGESADKRTALLDMDFELQDDDGDDEEERPSKKQKKEDDNMEEEESICHPVIDSEMQSELMATLPTQRLEHINELLSEKVDPLQEFKSDRYQLHILKAITLEQLGRSNKHRGDKKLGLENALEEWVKAIGFATKTFPPLDETTISLHVQAALCASVNSHGDWQKLAMRTKGLRVGDFARARHHANKAIEMHDALFGGGTYRFKKRYLEDLFNSPKMRSQQSEAQMLFTLRDIFGITDDMWEEE